MTINPCYITPSLLLTVKAMVSGYDSGIHPQRKNEVRQTYSAEIVGARGVVLRPTLTLLSCQKTRHE